MPLPDQIAAPAPVALLAGRKLAAPSWVMPGSLLENCVFLSGKVDEIGLVFFETESCLAYGPEELPLSLQHIPVSYHVHLPLDLPDDGVRAGHTCWRLLQRVAFLAGDGQPHLRGVLHPRPVVHGNHRTAAAWLEATLRSFAAAGGDPSLLLLENIPGNDLLSHHTLIERYNLGICFDLGHVLHAGQMCLADDIRLMRRVAMIHVNAPAPDKPSRHAPLTVLTSEQAAYAEQMLRQLPQTAVVMMELFSWEHIMQSLPVIRSWLLPLQ